MEVLVNADDFGLTKGVNDGIIEAHLNGIVSSATMMMNGLAVEEAVQAAKHHPSLKVGVHLVLTWGKALCPDLRLLVDEEGTFRYRSNFREMNVPDLEETEKEWRTQLEAFLATGLPLHHIDSHHLIHGWEPLKELVHNLATDYRVPVRYVPSLQNSPDILLTDVLWTEFYGKGVTYNIFDQLRSLKAESVEVMTHPAFSDKQLQTISSYSTPRNREREILCSLQVPDWVTIL
ncbi:chitin disaccharide deacetylase [Virgibacillus senegalensis]|uniref:chitin disaccharide deacetylase n=1 Tax=Virgibacillus senegalensis TaxID=1499679 RepID=UPI00069D53C2|nr:chitin disaccharide deacetylase [Virgibacillus senegalensis]